jgi:sigma-B regulation protein RsbU (phosphoserine phosphatase)
MQSASSQPLLSVPAVPESVPQRTHAVGTDRGARVLIVDDNEINRRVLAGMLRKERYALLSASDGEQALAIARAEVPDLILLDIMMPGRDGYEVCTALKAEPRTERIPVIFLSALADTADKIKGLELGAVDYITKPFDQGEVVARVRSQIKIQYLASAVLRANRDLRAKQERLDEDLKAAGAIQRSLLPSTPPPVASLHVAWRFMPSDRVGGDLFNFVPLGDDALGIFVIDVSGHGVPAAMVTVSLSQFLSPQAGHLVRRDAAGVLQPLAPAAVLDCLEAEYPLERFDKYFTIAYLVIDHRTGRLRYSLGGHPQPIVARADGTIEPLDAGGPLVGMGCGLAFDEGEVALGPGDRVFVYTDGIVDLAAPDGTVFGDGRLRGAIAAARRHSLDEACTRLLDTALGFGAGEQPQDDITLLGIEFAGTTRPAR